MDCNFHFDLLQQLPRICIAYRCTTYVHWARYFVICILRPIVSLRHFFGLQLACREVIVDLHDLSIALADLVFDIFQTPWLTLEESLLELSALL